MELEVYYPIYLYEGLKELSSSEKGAKRMAQ